MKITWLARRRPLELDLLHPGVTTANRPAQLALLAASIPLLVMAILGYVQEARTVSQQSAASDLAPPRPRAHTPRTQSSSADARLRAASVAQARAIQAQLNYPWQSFLAMLESAPHDDVSLLALEPDRRSGVTRIKAQARNMSAMLAYLDELQKSGAFDDVVLASHELETRRPGTPVRFELQAHWHAGFPLERQPAPQAAPVMQPAAAIAAPPAAAIRPVAVAATAQGH